MARDGERAAIVTRGLCLDAQPRGEHGVRHGDGSRDGIQPLAGRVNEEGASEEERRWDEFERV
jgi:hypothetical protein